MNRARPGRFDVLGLGCAAVDDILYVENYPPADAKVYVHRRERHCGGLTATALVAAARLGARCAFAGTLGLDEDSNFVLETLRREGVNIDHVVRRRGAGPVRSTIVVDERRGSRTIFAHVADVRGADSKLPPASIVQSARVLLIDHFGVSGNLRAARIARAAGMAVISDFERTRQPRMEELMAFVDHPIFSRRAAAEFTGVTEPVDAARKLWNDSREAVVVTCGADGAWFVSRNNVTPGHVPAFEVNAVDTTGCGDVFHGAYAAALAFGLPTEERVRFASAAAALKTTRHGGQAGCPKRRAVSALLAQAAKPEDE
jgi:sugar/nucleoside kinase (ribokinase family)